MRTKNTNLSYKQLLSRLKGYHGHFRGRFLLLKYKLLTPGEFILWDLSFSVLADWDKSHISTYGTFGNTWEEIGTLLSRDGTTVSRQAEKLFSLGFWRVRNDGRIEIVGFSIRDNLADLTRKKGIISLHEYIANLNGENVETQDISSPVHDNPSKEKDTFQIQKPAKLQENDSK